MIFHSQDLMVVGEESGARVECQNTCILDIGNDASNPTRVYFIPFESGGTTVFDTYTVNITITPTLPDDEYRYIFAIYTQHEKLSDTATAEGVGKIVPNSTLTGPTWTGNHILRDTTQLSAPVVLLQGSYFIAFTIEAVSKLGGPLSVIASDCINANSGGYTWVTESHLQGTLATTGVLPTNITTNDAALSGLDNTFTWFDSIWAGISYNGDALH